jgi:hypothetical protein
MTKKKSALFTNIIDKAKKGEEVSMSNLAHMLNEEKEAPSTPDPVHEPEPEAEDKEETESGEKKRRTRSELIIDKLKQNKNPMEGEWASAKIKKDINTEFKKIAANENIQFHGHLINDVLQDFIDDYYKNKAKKNRG